MSRAPAERGGAGRRVVGVAAWAAVAWVVGVALLPALTTAQYGPGTYPDLQGDYCRARRQSEQCCNGRYDGCSMPILGTLCYCDQFCNRTIHPDCCPDYWEVCLGLRPPPYIQPCRKDGVTIIPGQTKKFNCNDCTCVDGQLQCENDPCMVDDEVIQRVNGNPRIYGWTATNYSMFWGRKAREGLTLKTGTLNPEALSMGMYPILLKPDPERIPREFDARREWPRWISPVRDQEWCGSSWAFSTLGVAQDRLAVESQGIDDVDLSPQDLLSCDRRGQSGCKGGHVDRAWQYLRNIGVVSESCFPYESGASGRVPECRFHLNSQGCVGQEVPEFHRWEPAYRISGKEEDIQWEIMTKGPVQAMMKVQRDLFMYRGGVYAASAFTDGDTVTHSVRILGWGEEPSYTGQSTKYWLVANSWGKQWGEDGLFRIRRGYNESDIESFILAVHAILHDTDRLLRGRLGRRRGRGGLRAQRRAQRYDYHRFYRTKRRQ